MSGNTPKNFFDHAKKTAADVLKATSKRVKKYLIPKERYVSPEER